MSWDYLLMFSLAVLAVIDLNLERYSGRGFIARVQDEIERRFGHMTDASPAESAWSAARQDFWKASAATLIKLLKKA